MNTTFNFSSKDQLNAIAALPLQSIKGNTITLTGIAVDNRPDRDGQIVTIGYIKDADNNIYTTISDTVIRGLQALVEYMSEESLDEVDVKIATKKSKNNREFYILELV